MPMVSTNLPLPRSTPAAEELVATAALLPASLATFRASVEPAWIEDALRSTGRALADGRGASPRKRAGTIVRIGISLTPTYVAPCLRSASWTVGLPFAIRSSGMPLPLPTA